jgi:DegV family protein with EDD domain
MAVRIVTDSTSDITQTMAKELDITVVPLHFAFGDETYADGVDMTNEEFYQRLRATEQIPVTSQVTVGEFEEAFRKLLSDNDGDEIVGVFISSQMSGTYQSACIAAKLVNERRIHIAESMTTTMGLHLFARQAVALRDRGLGASDIAAELGRLAGLVQVYAVIGNLKYLYKGGRISAVGSMAGTLLGIKPIIRIDRSGLVEMAGKERGMKSALRWILQQTAQEIDPSSPVCFGHIEAPEDLSELTAASGDYIAPPSHYLSCIGPVVGTHAGPGCVGLSFIRKS